jgi:2-oxoglutarate ferredoxin oxidoreductase subunit alpha
VATARETLVMHDNFDVIDRIRTGNTPPFCSDEPGRVPPMPALGEGARLLVTGSTHDERGFRKVHEPAAHEKLVTALMQKTTTRADELVETESLGLDDADIAFFCYGISARSALAAVETLRRKGKKVGLLRTRTLWPFPEKPVIELGDRVEHVIVPECNTGQVAGVVRALSRAPVHPFTRTDGSPIDPSDLVAFAEAL